jgi:hypothetical protein
MDVYIFYIKHIKQLKCVLTGNGGIVVNEIILFIEKEL